MKTLYFKNRGKEEKNFPVTTEDGKTYQIHNLILGNRVVFSGTFEECHQWHINRLMGGVIGI